LFARPHCDRREGRRAQAALEVVRFKFNHDRTCNIDHLTGNNSHFLELSTEAEPAYDFVLRMGDVKLKPCPADTLLPFLPLLEAT
jgi:hypothetical protein